MSDDDYTLIWIGFVFWRLSIRYRPSLGAWIQRTDYPFVGVGRESSP
jgi:hypothetical protein